MGNTNSKVFGLPSILGNNNNNNQANPTNSNNLPRPPIIYGKDKYTIPPNSGTIDIDIQNLQNCMAISGNSLQMANNCVLNYVQGYDTNNNTFTPIQLAQIQNFEMLDSKKNFNLLAYIIVVLIYLIIMLK